MHGPVGSFRSLPKPAGISELLYQIQRFHSFLWASGGNFSDFYIHIIDHLCWMKNAWPVKAQALGGRHYRQSPEGVTYVDQNFDTYSVEYTFADGTKFNMDGRCMAGCQRVSTPATSTAAKAWRSPPRAATAGRPPASTRARARSARTCSGSPRSRPSEQDPYQNEWNDLIDAIRNDKPYNEAKRGVEASLVTSMGRMAAHTGQEITFEEMLNCEHEIAPGLDKLTMDSPAPLQAGRQRQVSRPAAGHRQESRVLSIRLEYLTGGSVKACS